MKLSSAWTYKLKDRLVLPTTFILAPLFISLIINDTFISYAIPTVWYIYYTRRQNKIKRLREENYRHNIEWMIKQEDVETDLMINASKRMAENKNNTDKTSN